MFICMKTTLNVDDHLMRELKRRAADTGRTMTEIVESALRDLLSREAAPESRQAFDWVTVAGTARPRVDISDRNALYDLMDPE